MARELGGAWLCECGEVVPDEVMWERSCATAREVGKRAAEHWERLIVDRLTS